MEFLKKFKISKFSYEELVYLNSLLKTNSSLVDSLDLLQTSKNVFMIEDINLKFKQGQNIEDSILKYMPEKISVYLKYLVKHMSFVSALDLSLAFYKEGQENEKKISKKIAYPLALLFASLTGLYLFDMYGIDSIVGLLEGFKTDLSSFSRARIIIRIIIYILYFSTLILTILLYIFTRPKKITVLYLFISKYLPNCLVQTYFCVEFISLFLICNNKGYKTKESLEILKSMKNKPIISLLAFHLDEALLDGKQFNEAFKTNLYDETLAKYIKIGVYTNDFCKVISNYVELGKLKIEKTMKAITLFIQLITYLFIGLIIIFVYEVLFLPMQAIVGY